MGWGWLGAQAQSGDTPAMSNDVVARLSLIRGSVSTQRADTGEWQTGAINTPLVSGDKVAAGPGSRAEIQLDYADLLRLGDNAQANLVSLTRTGIQVQLASGLADYVVLRNPRATSEIDTPNIAIRPRGTGVFRILVNSDSETQVIVRRGEADISTPQGSTTLRAGQQITVEGVNTPEYKITDAPGEDSWDQWNRRLDAKVEDASNYRYVNPYYTGAQDLGNYGYWTYVPGYGEVWVPYNQDNGWTPYSHGRWDWEPYWGWTWVGYEPWGWAPYHYGRWFPYGSTWVWWPGPVTPYYRPVWAPAYVSFFGWGGGGIGVSVGFGWGSVGWLPIGPCDPFRPWWGGYGFHAVNIYNIRDYGRYGRVIPPLAVVGRGRVRYSNLDDIANNERLRRAIVRVPANDFRRGVVAGRQRVTVADIRSGQALSGRLPLLPTRASLGGGRWLPHSVVARPVATRFFGHTPAATRTNFQTERARLQNNIRAAGRPAPAPNQRFRASGSVRPTPLSTAPRTNFRMRPNAPARPGFQRFGGANTPQGRSNAPQGRSNAAPNRGFRSAAPRPAPHVAAPPSRPGFQRFGGTPHGRTYTSPQGRANPAPQAGRPFTPGGGGFRSAAPAVRPSRPGFQQFRPQPQSNAGTRSYAAPAYGGRPYPGGGYANSGGGYRNYGGRPPLAVGHDIVGPRPPSRPSYNPPRGSYGRPAGGGGGYRAPQGGGGHYSPPPRGGGGAPHGGGGVPHGGGRPHGPGRG